MDRADGGAWAKFGAALLAVLVLGGCGWLELAVGALSTPTSGDDASTNVAVAQGAAYVARSARGIERIDLASGRRALTPVPAGVDRIDDLSIADGLLFALDAMPPGNLLVYRIERNGGLRRVAQAEVPVGPFSGVAASGGHVIVSGGTSALSLYDYDARGMLVGRPANADFGRGQPDVALEPGGTVALVSTHVRGPRFGLTVADVRARPLALRERGYVELEGAGFTGGGFHPANFPLQSAAIGDFVLVAHGGGLSVLSAKAQQPLRFVGTTKLPLHATAIAVDAGRRLAFVAGVAPRNELLTLDITDPRAPRVVERRALPANGSPSALAFDATHLVVAMQGGGVYIRARPAPASVASNLETYP